MLTYFDWFDDWYWEEIELWERNALTDDAMDVIADIILEAAARLYHGRVSG